MASTKKKKTLKDRIHAEKIRYYIFASLLAGIVFVSSTYAWFIGLQEVTVEDFEIDIASTDTLMLSLDGENWDSTISFTKDTLKDQVYKLPNDENGKKVYPYNWPKTGIVPLSTVGEMDVNSSRMIIYEKASLSTTPGGYKLLASRINNYGAPVNNGEKIQNGYLAFDLFIKNFSGTHYIEELNPRNEEAIYLTTDSSVTLGSLGVEGTGIENSVRVAFGQVGRVTAFNQTPSVITSITCTNSPDELKGDDNYVTGICRDASIWEPNDKQHIEGAIAWYDKSCLLRTGEDNTSRESYIIGSSCKKLEDGVTLPTYAVAKEIYADDGVDIYDGEAYNGYDTSIINKLYAFPYFTDTTKMYTGTERQTFFSLAPNSITKIRIYVYLEGQDIDNYDLAAGGGQVKVNFGFTKSRFGEEDEDYEGPITDPSSNIPAGKDPIDING